MATISKFYLLDAATPDTGTMPTGAFVIGSITGTAAGGRTARDATNVAGASNPDVESTITATANQNSQTWEHRRFVSRPLAAHTFASGDGSWTWSYARSENNLNHNMAPILVWYLWRPSTGAAIGTYGTGEAGQINGTEPTSASTEQTESVTGFWGSSAGVGLDGDILVFEVVDRFTQSKSSALTSQFAYDGTTEASTTTCASFVTPPAALDLFVASVPSLPPISTTRPTRYQI